MRDDPEIEDLIEELLDIEIALGVLEVLERTGVKPAMVIKALEASGLVENDRTPFPTREDRLQGRDVWNFIAILVGAIFLSGIWISPLVKWLF